MQKSLKVFMKRYLQCKNYEKDYPTGTYRLDDGGV